MSSIPAHPRRSAKGGDRLDARYEPIDQRLESTHARILRALVWFDWRSLGDIAGDLGCAYEHGGVRSESRRAYDNVISKVRRLAKQGLVERQRCRGSIYEGFTGRCYEYRITTAGRVDLVRLSDNRYVEMTEPEDRWSALASVLR